MKKVEDDDSQSKTPPKSRNVKINDTKQDNDKTKPLPVTIHSDLIFWYPHYQATIELSEWMKQKNEGKK